MQKVCIIGAVCAFFKAVVTRIICIIGASYVNFGRRVLGGVDYWRGHVFGGGAVGKKGGGAVNAEQVGATQCRVVAAVVQQAEAGPILTFGQGPQRLPITRRRCGASLVHRHHFV